MLKSEPGDYAWDELVRDGKAGWDGVRNARAKNFIGTMRPGDLAFFYHSGGPKEVVGVCRVVSEPRRDPTQAKDEDRWLLVDVEPVKPMTRPVTLAEIKGEAELADMLLVRVSRLSVSPLTREQFRHILGMGATKLRV